MKGTILWVILTLAAIIALPVLLRPGTKPPPGDHDTLIIITPHNEATRHEFTRAFQLWYHQKTGRTVVIDWRTPGGASEISRYLASEMLASFELHWTRDLGRRWDQTIATSFDQPRVPLDDPSLAGEARRAFLASEASAGVDLFFGGGSFDHIRQAAAGRLVDSRVLQDHPEWLALPEQRDGEPFRDPEGRWIGIALAAFGLCYNTDVIARLGINPAPSQWTDLADPRLNGRVALSDPTQSGSAAKAFEMLIQQQMHRALAEGQTAEAGWARAMTLLRRIAANTRYFTDSASKVPWDVEAGNAAAGMVIDFYGRFQSEAVRRPDGTSRLVYITPEGGSSFGTDPIGLLRGAPNREVARQFIAFTLTPEGQKLWNWKPGTPGGPEKYALRRLPVLPTLYAPEYDAHRSDPDVHPYTTTPLVYRAQWTGRLFFAISFIVQTACIDSHQELRTAWEALIAADFPPQATALFDDTTALDYQRILDELAPALAQRDKIAHIRLAREWGERFRHQYREAAALARAGK